MADAKLTALTAASALAGADLFYISQGGVSKKATHTQLLTLVGTTYVPLAGGTMTGALTIASGTLTASAPALNITQTWNNGAVVFEAINVNVTNLASNYSSILQSWQVSGSTKAAIYSTGRVYGIEFLISTAAVLGLHTLTINGTSTECVAYSYANVADRGVALRHVAFCNPADGALWSDLIGDSANALALRNGTAQQIFRVYNTTDAGLTNYERLTITGVAGTSVNITAETLGTGGDNIDIVLTPAGTGAVRLLGPVIAGPSGLESVSLTYGGEYGVRVFSGAMYGWTAGSIAAGIDTAFARNAAGIVEVNNGIAATYRDLKLRNLIQTEYSQMTEMTAPSAPATNSVRIYAEDNGAGKTRLMALFATGSAVQLGIEP